MPHCPPKRTWRQLRPALDDLTRRKAREFHVRQRDIHEIGETPLSEDEMMRMFAP